MRRHHEMAATGAEPASHPVRHPWLILAVQGITGIRKEPFGQNSEAEVEAKTMEVEAQTIAATTCTEGGTMSPPPLLLLPSSPREEGRREGTSLWLPGRV